MSRFGKIVLVAGLLLSLALTLSACQSSQEPSAPVEDQAISAVDSSAAEDSAADPQSEMTMIEEMRSYTADAGTIREMGQVISLQSAVVVDGMVEPASTLIYNGDYTALFFGSGLIISDGSQEESIFFYPLLVDPPDSRGPYTKHFSYNEMVMELDWRFWQRDGELYLLYGGDNGLEEYSLFFLLQIDLSSGSIKNLYRSEEAFSCLDWVVQDESMYLLYKSLYNKDFGHKVVFQELALSNLAELETIDVFQDPDGMKRYVSFDVLDKNLFAVNYAVSLMDKWGSYNEYQITFGPDQPPLEKQLESSRQDLMKSIKALEKPIKPYDTKYEIVELESHVGERDSDSYEFNSAYGRIIGNDVEVYWLGSHIVVVDGEDVFQLWLGDLITHDLGGYEGVTSFYVVTFGTLKYYMTDEDLYLNFEGQGSAEYVGCHLLRYNYAAQEFTGYASYDGIQPAISIADGKALMLMRDSQAIRVNHYELYVIDLSIMAEVRQAQFEMILPVEDGYVRIDSIEMIEANRVLVKYTERRSGKEDNIVREYVQEID